MAERPALIRRLFITKEYNKWGIYKMRLCKNGEWTVVTVDDYIPCYYNGGPMFSRAQGDELWVLLLEKAYAKLHGNYYSLRYGFTSHGLLDLSGCPTEEFVFDKLDDLDEFYENLKEFDDQGFLMTAETSGFDDATEGGGPGAAGGLVSGHAYSVIQAK
jgi:calpain-15